MRARVVGGGAVRVARVGRRVSRPIADLRIDDDGRARAFALDDVR